MWNMSCCHWPNWFNLSILEMTTALIRHSVESNVRRILNNSNYNSDVTFLSSTYIIHNCQWFILHIKWLILLQMRCMFTACNYVSCFSHFFASFYLSVLLNRALFYSWNFSFYQDTASFYLILSRIIFLTMCLTFFFLLF